MVGLVELAADLLRLIPVVELGVLERGGHLRK
jgi:hypothetical protein